MKHFRHAAFVLFVLGLFAASAAAQKKPATKTPVKKPAAKTTTVPPLDVRAAREKIDIQVENLDGFLVKLGPIAAGLDQTEADAKVKPLSPKAAELHSKNKERVTTYIRDFRKVLGDIEAEFRTKPALQKYLPSITGLTDLVADAEDRAIEGRFVSAKEPLRAASTKMLDVLAALPK